MCFNWNEVETVPSFRIGGEVIETEVKSEVQGCSFNNKMGGVGLGFGLIIAGFQHDFIGNFGFGENGLFGNFASGVNISCQITPDDATLSSK